MKPFLKWVGSKRASADAIVEHIPLNALIGGTYYEPFLGAGSVFLRLKELHGVERAVLSDSNERLIRCWKGIQSSVEEVIEALSKLKTDKQTFEHMKRIDIDSRSNVEVATWFIYLNRTAFNGLYRVNQNGMFNVSFGKYDDPKLCDPEQLRGISKTLSNVQLIVSDFEHVRYNAKKGDVIYFDPPYVPVSKTASFDSYTRDRFGSDAQTRLRDLIVELKREGVHCLTSNSTAQFVDELYNEENGFKRELLSVRRAVNCKGDRRGKVGELLIY